MSRFFQTLLKYANIVLMLFIFSKIISLSSIYFTDDKEEQEISRMEAKKTSINNKIVSLKKTIEERNKINENIMNQSYVDNKEITEIVKEILGEIIDEELGMFKILGFQEKRDSKYINLYSIDLAVAYTPNSLFLFESLENSLLKEIKKNIKNINSRKSNALEIAMTNYEYRAKNSNLDFKFNLRKKINQGEKL